MLLLQALVVLYFAVALLAARHGDAWLAAQTTLLTLAVFVLYVHALRFAPSAEGFAEQASAVSGADAALGVAPPTSGVDMSVYENLQALLGQPTTVVATGGAVSAPAATAAAAPAPLLAPAPAPAVPRVIAPIPPELRALAGSGRNLTLYYNSFWEIEKTGGAAPVRTWPSWMPPSAGVGGAAYGGGDPGTLVFQPPTNIETQYGYSLTGTVLEGPPSHQLGIQGDGSFTVFCTLRFTGFGSGAAAGVAGAAEATAAKDLFRIYANTPTLNGLALTVTNATLASPSAPTLYNVDMVLQFGSKTYCVCGAPGSTVSVPATEAAGTGAAAGQAFAVEGLVVDTSKVYTLVIAKDAQNRTLTMWSLEDHRNTVPELNKKIVAGAAVQAEDVLLSNKPLTFNPNRNMQAVLYALGFYNKALSEAEVGVLREHLKDFVDLLDAEVTGLREQLNAFLACPYDSAYVCANACENITSASNWGRPNVLLGSASPACLTAIAGYCRSNVTRPECECWDPAKTKYSDPGCVTLRRAYDPVSYLDKTALTDDDLSFIKANYDSKLCPAPPPPPPPVVPVAAPAPPPAVPHIDAGALEPLPQSPNFWKWLLGLN
jgi:hypothetical protein